MKILTQEQVNDIRCKYQKEKNNKGQIYTLGMLASLYNVSKGNIQSILKKRTWKSSNDNKLIEITNT